jgi:hypothetical protein
MPKIARRLRQNCFYRAKSTIHQTLKVTPAMAAGVTGKLWEMSDMVNVLEDWEATKQAA